MLAFQYPPEPHRRRHGPDGYRRYERYRDWLRDEFLFRCVYCLHREKWYGREMTFQIDHLNPEANDPQGTLRYDNLVYTCSTCNNAKRDILGIPDPCRVAFGECLRVEEDGQVVSLNQQGESLVKKLRLNSPSNVRYRARWIRVLNDLQISKLVHYREFMSFPEELPDLRTGRRVPRNSRPEGVENCWHALRERGELPEIY